MVGKISMIVNSMSKMKHIKNNYDLRLNEYC